MTRNKQFVLEEIKIYSGSTKVSVKKYQKAADFRK